MWQKCYYSVMYFNGYQIIVGGGTQQPLHYKCSYRVNRTHTQLMPERYEIQDCIKKQKLEILENHNILADNA